MLAKLGDKYALRTSCCTVANFAWLVVLGVACTVTHVHSALATGGKLWKGDYQRERPARADVSWLVWISLP